jgi:hypothetical protein
MSLIFGADLIRNSGCQLENIRHSFVRLLTKYDTNVQNYLRVYVRLYVRVYSRVYSRLFTRLFARLTAGLSASLTRDCV